MSLEIAVSRPGIGCPPNPAAEITERYKALAQSDPDSARHVPHSVEP